jgi:hypothetical protein
MRDISNNTDIYYLKFKLVLVQLQKQKQKLFNNMNYYIKPALGAFFESLRLFMEIPPTSLITMQGAKLRINYNYHIIAWKNIFCFCLNTRTLFTTLTKVCLKPLS